MVRSASKVMAVLPRTHAKNARWLVWFSGDDRLGAGSEAVGRQFGGEMAGAVRGRDLPRCREAFRPPADPGGVAFSEKRHRQTAADHHPAWQ